MNIKHDQEANATYITINPDLPITRTIDYETPSATIIIDFSEATVVGVEILHD
jgi:uncharacterized protein YuzE